MSVFFRGLASINGEIEGTNGDRTQSLTFQLDSDIDPLTLGESAIISAAVFGSGFDIGSAYPFDPLSYCNKISAKCNARHVGGVKTFWTWEATFEFSSKTEGKDGNQSKPDREKDGTKRPPRITVSTRTVQTPVSTRDVDNKRIENSAGDPFVRTKNYSYIVWRWERIVKTWNWQVNRAAPDGYLWSRNAAPWTPAGPYGTIIGNSSVGAGKAQIQSITSDVLFDNGGCVQVSCEIATDENSFADILLDQGLFFNNTAGVYTPGVGEAASTVRRRFVDRHGVATGPQLLNGAGSPLAVGANPVQLSFQYYPTKDWNAPPFGGGAGSLFSLPG